MRGIQIIFEDYNEGELRAIVAGLSKNSNVRIRVVEDDLSELLNELGISANLKGYHYIKTAVELCMKNDEFLNCITKSLYPEIARRHGVNTIKVEHAIRHAIDKAWQKEETSLRRTVFGNTLITGVRPTNATFIAAISDYLELRRI